MNKSKIKYLEVTKFSDPKVKNYLKWWSDHTKKEQRMLDRSTAFFKMNLLFAVFVFYDRRLIGAAGLIKCLDRHNKPMLCVKESLVVELISNFVDSDYRDQDIGTELVLCRLKFAQKQNYFPVSVTGSMIIQEIFSHVAEPMENFIEYNYIRREVRVCECDHKPCGICPLKDKAIWVFPKYIKK